MVQPLPSLYYLPRVPLAVASFLGNLASAIALGESGRQVASHCHAHHRDRSHIKFIRKEVLIEVPNARVGLRCSSAGHQPAGFRFG
ncbi:hypothetical protein EDB89DRAFT_2007943 [Lactarius sanguifluus]|nr:hypothetical protein EDB89DRAFT_2007943 [Lactarius sanguifluus]